MRSHSQSSLVVQHSTLVLLLQVILLVCAVSNNFLVAHIGGPDGKGVLYILQLISAGLGLPILHFCLGSAAVFFLGQDRGFSRGQVASCMFIPSLILGSVPWIGLVVMWPWLHTYLTQSISSACLWTAVLSIPLIVLTFNVSVFSLGQQNIRDYNVLGSAPAVLFTVFLIAILSAHSTSVGWLVAAWALSISLPAIYALQKILRHANGVLLPDVGCLRASFKFGWRSHLGGVTQQLQHRAPVLMVGYFLPISQLGIYSLAIGLAELLWYIPNAISTVLLPHVASGTDEEATRGTPAFCRITMAVTGALGVVLGITTAILVPWLLPAFRGSLIPFFILLPGITLASVFKVLSSDFNGRGFPLKTFSPAFVTLIAEVICGIILIPKFGLVAAALVTTIAYALNSFLCSRSYRRMTGVPIVDVTVLQRGDLTRIHATVKGLWYFAILKYARATLSCAQQMLGK